jgi:DNA polymerase-3 subunit epsilon
MPEELEKAKIIVIDTETTGMNCSAQNGAGSSDEILQLAIIDGTGAPLFYQTFCPLRKTQWPDAQRIHGISPTMVQGMPSFENSRTRIQNIINDANLLIAYNADFDVKFLRNQGIVIRTDKIFCLMRAFAKSYGQRKSHRAGYVWKSLEFCAKHCGYPGFKAHDALEDARATLFCYNKLYA